MYTHLGKFWQAPTKNDTGSHTTHALRVARSATLIIVCSCVVLVTCISR
jgi:hypothetical protein